MKCFAFFVLYLASLCSNVYSLGLNITSLNGYTAVVNWTRDQFDPVPLAFDLRFVIPPYYDVGLAVSSIIPRSTESSGNITVEFPQDGTYMIVAVSGPTDFQIGRTATVVVPGNIIVSQTPTPAPSPTPTSSQTPIPSLPSPAKSSDCGCLVRKANVAAIVGGVFGGLSLISVIVFAIFYFRKRQRPYQDSRISFHGERMVQQIPSNDPNPSVGRGGIVIPYPFTAPRSSLGSTSQDTTRYDIEQGIPVPSPAITSLPPKPSESRPSTPLASGHIVPPPLGPRDRSKSVRRIEPTPASRAHVVPTARQRRLAEKLTEVEQQLGKVKSEPKPSPSTIVLVDDLEMQRAWLVKQQDSLWALERIDTLPPGYSRYMV